MRIVKLIAENVKRLHAIEIEPHATVIKIGGKNSAGKSTVLDCIEMAMGGLDAVPEEPIRTGETHARIVADLGDLVITRKFRREIIHQSSCKTLNTENVEAVSCDCQTTFSEATSTLVVANRDGARYPSAQTMLERLYGRLTFDPLKFARDDPKAQGATLAKLVNLDFTLIDNRRKLAFAERALLKKTLDVKDAQILAMPHYVDVPDAEISMDQISHEMLRAEELRKVADEADRAVSKVREDNITRERAHQSIKDYTESLERQILELQERQRQGIEKLNKLHSEIEAGEIELATWTSAAQVARSAVPDSVALRARIADIEATNVKVRANAARAKALAESEGLAQQVATQHEAVKSADEAKRAALDAAQFPVAGLGLDEGLVTLNGLPLGQAGRAEQIRVSVAIGIAMNPTLKVLLVRDGNLLDEDSLRAISEQAEAAGYQIWMEWMTPSADGVTVMLTEGRMDT